MSAQQDEPRYGIRGTPDDRVLLQLPAERPGGLKVQPQDQHTRLGGPPVGGMLALPFQEPQPAAAQLVKQGRLPGLVLRGIQGATEGIAGGQERAAVDAMPQMQVPQRAIEPVHAQGQAAVVQHPVMRLGVGPKGVRVDGSGCVQALDSPLQGGPTQLPFRCSFQGAPSASAIHLARAGRLAWASAHLLMWMEIYNRATSPATLAEILPGVLSRCVGELITWP